MPRPPIRRYVEHLPHVTHFKPAGVPLRQLEEVELTVDELEALRLKDLEGLEQEEAAERMGVARTTFRRVLVSARSKVAQALVEGKAIRIEGGPYVHVGAVVCADCGERFQPEPAAGSGVCPRCGSPRLEPGAGRGRHRCRRGWRHGTPGRATERGGGWGWEET